jgi:hypothetical protein
MTEETMPRTWPRVCVQILDGRVLAVLAPAVSAPLPFCRDKKRRTKSHKKRSDKEKEQESLLEKMSSASKEAFKREWRQLIK